MATLTWLPRVRAKTAAGRPVASWNSAVDRSRAGWIPIFWSRPARLDGPTGLPARSPGEGQREVPVSPRTHQPGVDALDRVPLLARRVQIRTQPPVDDLLQRLQLRRPPRRGLSRSRLGMRRRLPHQPPVHPVLTGQRSHRVLAA
jgi:hypothetical protein